MPRRRQTVPSKTLYEKYNQTLDRLDNAKTMTTFHHFERRALNLWLKMPLTLKRLVFKHRPQTYPHQFAEPHRERLK